VTSPMHAAMISILLWSTASDPQLPAPLTIGNPSPRLAAMKFVRGDAVAELSARTIYVVEFSGTECVPCLKCVPHMNQLQKEHADVVFLSVYCEPEKAVRGFLAGKGNDIAIRVAVDPDGRMLRDWSGPAYQEGIPHAFLIGKDRRIAWIGSPADLAEPLAQVVAGTFNPQEHVLRLKVEQEAALRLGQARERAEKGLQEAERINDLIAAGKMADALADTEKALISYRDCPEAMELLRFRRVVLLANLPGRREEAFRLATELAVEAKMSGRYFVRVNTAKGLLGTASFFEPGARDTRLIDLALPLLCDPSSRDLDLRHKPDDVLRDYQMTTLRFRGYAYHLRGNTARATGTIRDAIAIIRDLKPPSGADVKTFADKVQRQLQDLQGLLKEYSEKTPPSPKDQR
jgi:hypothetical protein